MVAVSPPSPDAAEHCAPPLEHASAHNPICSSQGRNQPVHARDCASAVQKTRTSARAIRPRRTARSGLGGAVTVSFLSAYERRLPQAQRSWRTDPGSREPHGAHVTESRVVAPGGDGNVATSPSLPRGSMRSAASAIAARSRSGDRRLARSYGSTRATPRRAARAPTMRSRPRPCCVTPTKVCLPRTDRNTGHSATVEATAAQIGSAGPARAIAIIQGLPGTSVAEMLA
jgi:hypothetical protein